MRWLPLASANIAEKISAQGVLLHRHLIVSLRVLAPKVHGGALRAYDLKIEKGETKRKARRRLIMATTRGLAAVNCVVFMISLFFVARIADAYYDNYANPNIWSQSEQVRETMELLFPNRTAVIDPQGRMNTLESTLAQISHIPPLKYQCSKIKLSAEARNCEITI